MSGPPRKPTHLKVLEGNPGKKRLPVNEPKPRPVAPKRPSWLDREAKREWKRVAPELERLGLLTIVDGAALAAYCVSYSRWRQAEEILQREGLVCTAGSGYMMPRPEVAIANKAMLLIRAFAAEFGLTPAARARITLPSQAAEDDPLERMLK